MSPGRIGFTRPYALFIIVLMVLGVIGGVYYFYDLGVSQANPCGVPTKATFSKVYFMTIQTQSWEMVNATFTESQPGSFVFPAVTFQTLAFSDPTIPHLISGVCGTDNTTPASISLQVTFSKDGAVETIPTMQFKGQIQGPTYQCSTHTGPQACVVWYSKDPYVILQVTTS